MAKHPLWARLDLNTKKHFLLFLLLLIPPTASSKRWVSSRRGIIVHYNVILYTVSRAIQKVCLWQKMWIPMTCKYGAHENIPFPQINFTCITIFKWKILYLFIHNTIVTTYFLISPFLCSRAWRYSRYTSQQGIIIIKLKPMSFGAYVF